MPLATVRGLKGDRLNMTFGPMQVRPGMTVVDTRGSTVGRVSEAGAEQFVVERSDQGQISIGYDAVRALLGDQVVLNTGPDLDSGEERRD
jgi:sporulation protein YlmC with PRC-barrel domain